MRILPLKLTKSRTAVLPEYNGTAVFLYAVRLSESVLFDYLSFRRVFLDALNSVETAALCLVALGNGNYLAVSRLETETVLASLVNIHFKLGVLLLYNLFDGLILDLADAVVLYALNALHACRFGCINLRRCDDLAVSRLEVKLNAGVGTFYYEFSHDINILSGFNSITALLIAYSYAVPQNYFNTCMI